MARTKQASLVAAAASLCLACSEAPSRGPSEPASSAHPFEPVASARPIKPATAPSAEPTAVVTSAEPAVPSLDPNAPAPMPAGAGQIACGAERCAVASQICCFRRVAGDPSFRIAAACIPRAEMAECVAMSFDPTSLVADHGEAWACDESKDCPGGQTCCASSPTEDITKDRAPVRQCSHRPCPLAEVCDATSCGKGQTCAEGSCERQDLSVHCGDRTCEGATPWCRHQGRDVPGECVARQTINPQSGSPVLRCDADSDCVKGQRCYVGQGSSSHCCGPACFDHITYSKWFFCKTSADCQRPDLAPYKLDCLSDPQLPKGLKHCGQQRP